MGYLTLGQHFGLGIAWLDLPERSEGGDNCKGLPPKPATQNSQQNLDVALRARPLKFADLGVYVPMVWAENHPIVTSMCGA